MERETVSARSGFDLEKTLEVLLYVAEHDCIDTYAVLKVLYFADKRHLGEYGRLICGDSYVAMSHGPVPSGAYDIVKYARGDGYCLSDIPIGGAFAVQDNDIVPHRAADRDLLSESDVECLDWAIAAYGHLSFGELRRLSHDAAYEAADRNDLIPLQAIVRSLPDGELLADFLANG